MFTTSGSYTEFCLYTAPIVDPCLQWISQGIFTRSSASNLTFWWHTILRPKDKLKITTSGWKCTFGCSVLMTKTIGQICFQWWNLHTIITITPQSTPCPSLWTMATTLLSWMFQVLCSPTNPTNRSNRSRMHKTSANVWLSDLKRCQNKHMTNGKVRTLVLKLVTWYGLKWQTSQQMSPCQNSWASATGHSKSRRNYWTWLTTLSFPHDGGFTMFFTLTSFPKQNLTWFPDVSNLCCLLLWLTTRTSGWLRSI